MAIELIIPDMGEGIEDVTINRWVVQVGSTVNEGDAVVEVATDKVDTEVPATASGTILKINFSEGELADVGSVFAIVGEAGESGESVENRSSSAKSAGTVEAAQPAAMPEPVATVNNEPDVKASPVAKRVAADKNVPLSAVAGTGPRGQITKDDVLSYTPVDAAVGDTAEALPGDLADVPTLAVRRLVASSGINLAEVAEGRPLSTLTKYDILSAIASREAGETVTIAPRLVTAKVDAPPTASPQAAIPAPSVPANTPTAPAPKAASVATKVGTGEELVKLSRMRQAVARNTSQSAFTSPHVTTMWDINMSAVLAHRKAHKKEFAAAGVNLTVTAYFIPAVIAALRAVPAANATWTDEGVVLKRYYNIGMAVALPQDQYGMGGLIVPVIKNAGDLNLMGVARAVNELAVRSRDGKLTADDLSGGTFTLSNYGTSGSRFQTPIIVQPQVGILGTGAIEKRAVVISNGHPLEANTGDYLSFQPMTTLGFSYDHRVLDGATADAFCAVMKRELESWA